MLAEQLQRELDSAREDTVEDLKTFFADEAMARDLQDRLQKEAEEEMDQVIARENFARDPEGFPRPLAPAPNGAVSDGAEIPGLVARNPVPSEEAVTLLSALQHLDADRTLEDGKPLPTRKRNLALLDLLHSEHTFLLSLHILLTSTFAAFPTLIGVDPELTGDAYVRSGIVDVYLLHLALFRGLLGTISLELSSSLPARIGLQFTSLRSEFAVYSRYITHYHRLSSKLRQLGEWNTAFEADLRSENKSAGGVAEMWFLPVQRVMRYGMVLGGGLESGARVSGKGNSPR
jgi:hypothetical protein